MERQKSPLDDENKRRQNSAEKPSDASPSERLQKYRSSHLIGSGKNPGEWSNQQVGTDEASPSRVDRQNTTHHDTPNSLKHDADRGSSQDEKKAITTPSNGASDHSNTQGRNEKRQLSALEEALEEKWSQSISLDEYGHRLSKIIELTSIPTRDKPILVGGAKNFERGEPSHGNQGSEVDKWIGQKLGEYRLVEYLKEAEDKYGRMRLFYLGEHIESKETVEVDVPKGAGKWIGQKLGEFRIVDYKGEGGFAYVYRGEHTRKKRQVAIKVLRPDMVSETGVKQFRKEAEILKKLRHPHIVCGFESGKTKEGVDYLVMEYAPKGTLSDAYKGDTPLPWSLEKVVAMANVLADAFDYLHNDEGILHPGSQSQKCFAGSI